MKKSICLTVDEELIELAKEDAETEERSVSAIINRILKENYKERIKRKNGETITKSSQKDT